MLSIDFLCTFRIPSKIFCGLLRMIVIEFFVHFKDSFKDFLFTFENAVFRFLCTFRIASKIFCELLRMISVNFCAVL